MLDRVKVKVSTHIYLGGIIFLFSLGACNMGPNYSHPEVPLPASFRYTKQPPSTLLNLSWWELFDDEDLRNLIELALANNQDVLIASARLEEAQANYGFTKADLFPSLTYNLSASRQDQYIAPVDTRLTSNSFGAQSLLNWEIDFWGKFRRANESAQADMLSSLYGQRVVQIDLITQVSQTYFLLQDLKNRLAIARKTLESRKNSTSIIQARFDKGIVAEIDLNQALIQEAQAEAAVPLYTRLVVQAQNKLAILLGQSGMNFYFENSLIDIEPPYIPIGLPSDIMARRPDILQVEQQLVSQNAQIGVAQALRLPSISLTAALGFGSNELRNLLDGDHLTWSLGGGIVGPIFQFGKNQRRVDIAKARFQQDSLTYAKTLLNAFAEVENALVAVQTYKNESEAKNKQMKAAQQASKLSRARYNGGVTSFLEVLDSERTQFNTELEASQTYQEYLSSYILLYKALGGGWLSESEKQAYPQ